MLTTYTSGTEFEYLVAAYFQSQGYLVRRGLVYLENGNEIVELDIYGIKFLRPFLSSTIVCDCKDRVRPKPIERILWTKGVGEILNIHNTFVALPRVRKEAIDFAAKNNIKILTKDMLDSVVNSQEMYYGLADMGFYIPFYKKAYNIASKNRELKAMVNNVRSLYILGNPYSALNQALMLIDRVSNNLDIADKGHESYPIWRYILFELTVLVSLYITLIASACYGLRGGPLQQHIVLNLTFGETDPKKALEIMQVAVGYTSKVTMHGRMGTAPSAKDLIRPPKYAEAVACLVDWAHRDPDNYTLLPVLVDYLLFEQAFKTGNFDVDNFRRRFGDGDINAKLKVAKNIIVLIRDATKLDLKHIWPNVPHNLPNIGQDSSP